MMTTRNSLARITAIAAAGIVGTSLSVTAGHTQEVRFIPETAALGYAVRAYEAIWQAHGDAIVAALEARTCVRFSEANVSAVVADATSHSGGPDHPMQLRASYTTDVKQSTLVHELGHRHLWQLEERLDDVDGHMTLYLILDRVWADVWGEPFAEAQVRHESGWRSRYDYAEAWSWARSLGDDERARLWRELLALNGLESDCHPTAQ
jgi:hypothetical protein